MSTRSIQECQDLAKAWLAGKKRQVIDELGGEPSEKFLRDFGGWRGDPHKVYASAEKYTVSLPATDTPGAGTFVRDLIDPDHPLGEAGVGVKLPAPPPAKKKPSTKEKGTA